MIISTEKIKVKSKWVRLHLSDSLFSLTTYVTLIYNISVKRNGSVSSDDIKGKFSGLTVHFL